jgi:hypothetical protein
LNSNFVLAGFNTYLRVFNMSAGRVLQTIKLDKTAPPSVIDFLPSELKVRNILIDRHSWVIKKDSSRSIP